MFPGFRLFVVVWGCVAVLGLGLGGGLLALGVWGFITVVNHIAG